MNPLLIAYTEFRQYETGCEPCHWDVIEDNRSFRDRLGRTLITWGEHLVTRPRSDSSQERSAA